MQLEWIIGVFAAVMVSTAGATTIDLRNQSEVGSYEISFCARPSPGGGLPGHAFVSFSASQPGQKRDFISVGHTVSASNKTVSNIWSAMGGPVDGLITEERYTSAMERCLRTMVKKMTYDYLRLEAADPLAKMGLAVGLPVVQGYKLGSEDCITFAIGIAKQLEPLGLRIPARATADLPAGYILKLIRANSASSPQPPSNVSGEE